MKHNYKDYVVGTHFKAISMSIQSIYNFVFYEGVTKTISSNYLTCHMISQVHKTTKKQIGLTQRSPKTQKNIPKNPSYVK